MPAIECIRPSLVLRRDAARGTVAEIIRSRHPRLDASRFPGGAAVRQAGARTERVWHTRPVGVGWEWQFLPRRGRTGEAG